MKKKLNRSSRRDCLVYNVVLGDLKVVQNPEKVLFKKLNYKGYHFLFFCRYPIQLPQDCFDDNFKIF